MWFLMFTVVAIVTYIVTFNKDFNADDVAKAFPFIVICGILIFVASIMSNV